MATEASRIVKLLRAQELKQVWTKEVTNQIAEENEAPLYPGMQFALARDKIQETKLWKIVQKMPKGARASNYLVNYVSFVLT